MPTTKRLLAYMDPREAGQFLAGYFVETSAAADSGRALGVATGREPTTLLCSSRREARRWIAEEADALGLPVEWLVRAAE